METIKRIVFIELIGMFVTGIVHLICLFILKDFPITTYLIMFITLLFICLLTEYIIVPFAKWFFS